MNRIFLMLAILVATVSIGAAPQAPRIALAQEPTIDFIGQVTIPTSGNVKFPQIMGGGDTVHIAGSGGRGDDNFARYWRKSADGTLNFAEPRTLGPATGQPNYANSDVTVAPNGRVYVIANNVRDQAIYLWSSSDGTSWNPDDRKTVVRGGGFRVYSHIAASNNRLWVVWNQDGRYRYRTTTDVTGGGGWTETQLVSGRESLGHPSVAVSPDGSRMAVAYGTSRGDIFVGIWDGAGFTERLVADTNLYLVDPTIAFGPDNRIWVAWRAVEGGIFFSRENDQGNFPSSRISSAESYGTVSISVDPQGLGHIFWVGNRGDGWKAYYARQATDGSWGLRIADPGAFITNGIGTVTVSDFAYGHGVTEYFGGSGLVTRYYLFRSQGETKCFAQTITIGNAIAGTNPPVVKGASVVGSLTPSPGCTPAEQRVVLNAQDANAPAAPWIGKYDVQITNLEQCVQTIHVQLRANNRTQFDPQWRSATFIADPQAAGTPVDAAVEVMNPKMFGLIPPVFSPVSPAGDMMSEGGASNGDPGYTRIEQMHMRIADIGDCTGISAYNLLFDTSALFQNGTITGTFASNLPLPPQVQNQSLQVGETLFRIQVFDRAGNSVTLPRRMVYDPPGTNGEGRPVMDLSQTSLTTDTNTLTILRSLIINTIVVTDNLYRRGESVPTRGYTNNQTPPNSSDATKQFWGLWIAVEYLGKEANAETLRPPLPAGGLTFDNLRWQPVEVPNAAAGARVRFNLFEGVLDRTAPSPTNGFGPDLTKDGTYRVYVKALDGAGNASTATYSTTLRLDPGYEVPTIRLPIIRR
jgi:hypothetical protein